MHEWKETTLNDCLDALIDYRGKSPRKSSVGIPVISAKVVKAGTVKHPIEQTIEPSYYREWMRRGIPVVGDVVLTTEGPLGEVAQLNEATATYAIGQRVVVLRGSSKKLDNRFLKYALISPEMQRRLEAYATGTTVVGISQKALRSLSIPLPPIAEQQTIAETLGSLDDKIELNRRMNATLEGMAQAIFRDWFVDFGPTRRKQAGVNDPVQIMGNLLPDPTRAQALADLFSASFGDNGLPEEWVEGTLGDIARQITDTVSPPDIDATTPYIGLEHMPRRSIALTSWEVASKVTSNKARFRHGQILFGKLRPYFHKVGIAPIDGVCSTDIVVLDALDPINRSLVTACVSTDEFVAFTDQSSTGTKMPRTSWKIMKTFNLAKSPQRTTAAYSEIVAPMIGKILATVQENQTLAAIRDLLLPRLMSGEIRIGEAERLLKDVA